MTVSATSRFLVAAPESYEAGGVAFQPQSHQPAAAPVDGAELARPAEVRNDDFFGRGGPSFSDVLDVVNPLQHLPVVGSIYRELTGDSLAPGPRLAGGTLFGGPLGFATSLANVMVESVSGRDIGENVFAAMGGDTLFGDGPVEAADATAAGAAAIAPAAGPAAAPVAAAPAAAAPTAVAMAPAARSAASPAGAIHPVALTVAGPANTASAVPQLPAGAMTAAPSLSPEAFQALMDSIGAKPAGGPAAAAPAVPAAPSAAQPLPEPADAGRAQDAALEVHQILQSFAASRGGGAIPVKR